MTTNQRVDDWGRVVLTESGLLEMFYNGVEDTAELLADDTDAVIQYNKWCRTFDKTERQLPVFAPLDISPEVFHAQRQTEWLMPEKYQSMDIPAYLYAKCTTQAQKDRVTSELALFTKHRMVRVLQLLVYIVDTLRDNDILWGVGRGSSVASYCLFLIGIHRIDSLMYDLDISEFIKSD